MTTDDSNPEPADDSDDLDDDLPITEDLIDADMPCIRCHYNLRGLKPEGRCPECGARIEATVQFVMQRVLCPVCLRPNLPTAALCANCKSPITGAAATADYWRPTAISGGRKNRPHDDDDPPEPPSPTWMIMCWCAGTLCLLVLAIKCCQTWNQEPDPFASPSSQIASRVMSAALFLIAGLLPLALIFFPTRGYLRARREFASRLPLQNKTPSTPKTPINPINK